MKLSEKLLQHQMMLAAAESCTGGMFCARCTDEPGSSRWFDRGFVTYSNQAKSDMLGVPLALINTHGAVSEPVAKAMAEGALNNSHADVAISITGIAGPDGGSLEKPVGTVWFGFAMKGKKTITALKNFNGNRHEIRQQSCDFVELQIGLILDDCCSNGTM